MADDEPSLEPETGSVIPAASPGLGAEHSLRVFVVEELFAEWSRCPSCDESTGCPSSAAAAHWQYRLSFEFRRCGLKLASLGLPSNQYFCTSECRLYLDSQLGQVGVQRVARPG